MKKLNPVARIDGEMPLVSPVLVIEPLIERSSHGTIGGDLPIASDFDATGTRITKYLYLGKSLARNDRRYVSRVCKFVIISAFEKQGLALRHS